jgi:hypothetical protein
MKMQPVKSSNVKAVGYDPKAKTLSIEFHSGSKYEFGDVPAATHAELMASASKGKHFNRKIRGQFASEKVA